MVSHCPQDILHSFRKHFGGWGWQRLCATLHIGCRGIKMTQTPCWRSSQSKLHCIPQKTLLVVPAYFVILLFCAILSIHPRLPDSWMSSSQGLSFTFRPLRLCSCSSPFRSSTPHALALFLPGDLLLIHTCHSLRKAFLFTNSYSSEVVNT